MVQLVDRKSKSSMKKREKHITEILRDYHKEQAKEINDTHIIFTKSLQ